MVEIPSGKIELRDDRTKQKWTVEINPFFIGKFPVTQKLYFNITKQEQSNIKSKTNPVETVTWRDAVIFCNKLSIQTGLNPCYAFTNESEEITLDKIANGFRLPTEAEWEYACKAGKKEIRYGELNKIA